MFYEGMIYRPPSEANSVILQITVGCRHNTCTFCTMYKDKTFRVKSRSEIMEIIDIAQDQVPRADRIFLADGDAITVETDLLLEILDKLYAKFPRLEKVGIYGGPKDILAKTPEELAAIKKAGVTMLYLGVESGSADILRAVGKGVSPEQMIAAGKKLRESGIPLSCTIIVGLGGTARTSEHALETAKIISAIDPEYLGALTLMVHPSAAISKEIKKGTFQLLDPMACMVEIRELVQNLNVTNCVFRSNHASNYLPLRATLPADRDDLLAALDSIIDNQAHTRLRPESWRGL